MVILPEASFAQWSPAGFTVVLIYYPFTFATCHSYCFRNSSGYIQVADRTIVTGTGTPFPGWVILPVPMSNKQDLYNYGPFTERPDFKSVFLVAIGESTVRKYWLRVIGFDRVNQLFSSISTSSPEWSYDAMYSSPVKPFPERLTLFSAIPLPLLRHFTQSRCRLMNNQSLFEA